VGTAPHYSNNAANEIPIFDRNQRDRDVSCGEWLPITQGGEIVVNRGKPALAMAASALRNVLYFMP
jgi:hypothetical protein